MSDAAARREARRRRILENADNRLKRISNINRKNELDNEEVAESLNHVVENDVQSPKEMGNCMDLDQQIEDHVLEETLQSMPFVNTVKEQESVESVQQPIYRTLIILLLGLSVRYLNLIFSKFEYLVGIDLSYLEIDKIFLPLLAYECYVLLLVRPKFEDNMTMNIILLMNNINGKKVQPLLHVINIVVNVLKDMAIYFFAFIFVDLVFTVIAA